MNIRSVGTNREGMGRFLQKTEKTEQKVIRS